MKKVILITLVAIILLHGAVALSETINQKEAPTQTKPLPEYSELLKSPYDYIENADTQLVELPSNEEMVIFIQENNDRLLAYELEHIQLSCQGQNTSNLINKYNLTIRVPIDYQNVLLQNLKVFDTQIQQLNLQIEKFCQGKKAPFYTQ